ncbi:MAG: helix-turn-helix domain-containing protein [candidate division Zixibacteria bacterium]|nr:helix-turn-helix domain-containing protein [candidate division Zixibacteria bacterium]
MKVKNRVKLRPKEQALLKQIISKGSEKARKITRCRILVLANEGKTDTQIIEALRVARNTIRTVRFRYVREGLESALNEQPRPGAPKKFTGGQKAKITAIACSQPPEGRNRWTLRLIADRVVELKMIDSISHQTVKRVLKKTNSNLT